MDNDCSFHPSSYHTVGITFVNTTSKLPEKIVVFNHFAKTHPFNELFLFIEFPFRILCVCRVFVSSKMFMNFCRVKMTILT